MSQQWLHQFESDLDLLEREVSLSTGEYSVVFPMAELAVASLASGTGTKCWLVRKDAAEQILNDGHTAVVSTAEHARLMNATERGSSVLSQRLRVVHALARNLNFVLEVTYSELNGPQQSVLEGMQAVARLLAAFVSRDLLSQYEKQLARQTTLVDVVARLHESATISDVASVLAQDAAIVVDGCRLTLLIESENRYDVVAITGVRQPKLESASVAATKTLAVAVVAGRLPDSWLSMEGLAAGEFAASAAVLSDSGVRLFRAVSLKQVPETTALAADGVTVAAVLALEVFEVSSIPDDSIVNQLKSVAGPVLDKLHLRERSWLARKFGGRNRRRWVFLAAVLTLLAFWPADFEVEVEGRIESSNRRRMFAPEDGTVDTVFFQNETAVVKDQTLLQMSNPDIDLERQRVLGDIETTLAKLASVQAVQLSGADANSSADEQLFEKQLDSLRKQLDLVEIQTAALEVVAPFDGTVFLRNSRKELADRPVQRGQLLFEIVPHVGAWQLNLEIPDHLLSYIDTSRIVGERGVSVRYRIRATPDQDWTTRLTKVDNAVQVQDDQLVCWGTANLKELPNVALRPGTSVVARISCGRRSLGFVWFREVVEMWQQFRFAWL